MKNFAAILTLTIFFIVFVSIDCADEYTTKYDNINLDEILQNKRLLKNYVNCLLDKGNCSPDGMELKRVIPDALKTKCSKCNPRQQDGTRKVLKHLINKEPALWNELEKKYDPEGTYKKQYEEEAKKEGIVV